MFVATEQLRNNTDSERMIKLKTLLIGKTKSATLGMGYSGFFYTQAGPILEGKFGFPHLVFDAQLKALCEQQPIKAHGTHALSN